MVEIIVIVLFLVIGGWGVWLVGISIAWWLESEGSTNRIISCHLFVMALFLVAITTSAIMACLTGN